MEHVITNVPEPFRAAKGTWEVWQLPAWRDNLVWLLVDVATQEAAAVDGPEAAPVLALCKRQGFRLTTIFNTHTHPDHIGINRALEATGQLSRLTVVGPASRAKDIPGITTPVRDGSKVTFGGGTGRVLLTEGHLDGHISYLFDDLLFCGDTLFGGGCGYLFDGPPKKMHDSLQRLAQLPPETQVCCAHEYTEDNLRFALTVEPNSRALQARVADIRNRRARGEGTLPSTIGLERETNPFLRLHSQELMNNLKMQMPDADLSNDVVAFAALRALKDSKRYKEH